MLRMHGCREIRGCTCTLLCYAMHLSTSQAVGLLLVTGIVCPMINARSHCDVQHTRTQGSNDAHAHADSNTRASQNAHACRPFVVRFLVVLCPKNEAPQCRWIRYPPTQKCNTTTSGSETWGELRYRTKRDSQKPFPLFPIGTSVGS